MPSTTTILSLLTLALTVSARTDYEGCTSSKTIAYGGASLLWYVPGTGEICEPLDCGGGRAPPKTTVPGCAAYSGTGTYSPSYIAIATDSKTSSYSTAIGSWTSVASALSSASSKVAASASASASGKSSAMSSLATVPSTTAKATLSTSAAAAATGVASGGIVIDTSVVGNGTALSTSSRTPTAASASGSSTSSTATGAAGVVRLGRDAMVMIGGAVMGVALF